MCAVALLAGVAVSGASVSFDKEYSYIVPERLKAAVRTGSRVFVPFGRGGRRDVGLILSLRTGSLPRAQRRCCLS